MQSIVRDRISRRLVPATIACSMSLVFVLLVFSHSAEAATQPLAVYGYVHDSLGSPVSGASVTVLIVDSGASRTVSTTSLLGVYQIDPDFSTTDYNVGNTIRVTVVDSSLGTKVREYTITSQNETAQLMRLDVNFNTAIPEFGSMFGVLVAALVVGVVAVVAIGWKRK